MEPFKVVPLYLYTLYIGTLTWPMREKFVICPKKGQLVELLRQKEFVIWSKKGELVIWSKKGEFVAQPKKGELVYDMA